MKHPERVEDYLRHIEEAITRIASYILEIDDAHGLECDDRTQAAVIRYIEIIGEAANRIYKAAPEFVADHPALPWREMRAMRNRMIHNYFDVNIDLLWGTVKEDLPKLKLLIEELLNGSFYRPFNPRKGFFRWGLPATALILKAW